MDPQAVNEPGVQSGGEAALGVEPDAAGPGRGQGNRNRVQ